MNLKCKIFGHDTIIRDFYPNDPVTSIACMRCGEILKSYKNPTYSGSKNFDKMVCINNKNVTLTKGKIYEILYSRDSYFYIINDKGEVKNYLPAMFITIKQYRKLKLEKINESR
jgi:hypothetical protein